ncbi:ferrochelatase [Anaerolineales bacterium HSG6]|nr:ferrochelatase [Anaerolineales bacterium HSG6]
MTKKAVLMMAYGTPENIDRMRCYLSDIRGGRPMSDEFVAEFRHRYDLVGGGTGKGSPLATLTLDQAKKTSEELQRRGHDWPVYIGMRHWSPWIKDAVAQMYLHGIEEVSCIVLAPHYSKMSIGKYWQKVEEAQARIGSQINFSFVDAWYGQPKFEQAVETHIRQALEDKFAPEVRDKVKIIFTAHSLPERLLKMGDPYDDQLKSNAKAIAARLGDVDWTFSYQSAADTGEPWLGPQIETAVADLAKEGYQHLLIVPIGFVCDHVEILYDIDIEVQEIAKTLNIQVERTESMNSDPVFIEAIVDAIVAG